MTSVQSVGVDRPDTYVPITIASGIRTSATGTPDKIALAEGERTLTYRELVTRIDRVANAAVHDLGLAPGDRVALIAPNCLEFLEIVCGIASAGCSVVTVNSRATPREAALICNDSQASVAFAHPATEEVMRDAELETVQRIIVIGDEYEQWLGQSRAVAPDVSIEEWTPFCIPYTSGTTGTPKGVVLPHRARTLTFFAMAVVFGCYSASDRALGMAPMYHGAGFAFAAAPVFFGGFCEILPRFDPEQVMRRLKEGAMTNVFMVPSHFQGLFSLGDDFLEANRPEHLRAIISNAAPLSQAAKEQIIEYFGEGLLHECYGTTETSITTSIGPEHHLRKEQSVGLPFPCAELRLLDDTGQPVAEREVGEVHIRSPLMFNGYWNKPRETSESLREGWFASGDLAYQDDEGYLYIVDRKNDKIISGGVNIYPREVEEAIMRHPAVREVGVFGVPDEFWGEAVHAAVVLTPGQEVGSEEILEACADLGRYKLPKEVEFIDVLPRNGAGKLLRRELRAAYSSRA